MRFCKEEKPQTTTTMMEPLPLRSQRRSLITEGKEGGARRSALCSGEFWVSLRRHRATTQTKIGTREILYSNLFLHAPPSLTLFDAIVVQPETGAHFGIGIF